MRKGLCVRLRACVCVRVRAHACVLGGEEGCSLLPEPTRGAGRCGNAEHALRRSAGDEMGISDNLNRKKKKKKTLGLKEMSYDPPLLALLFLIWFL